MTVERNGCGLWILKNCPSVLIVPQTFSYISCVDNMYTIILHTLPKAISISLPNKDI